MLLIEKNEGDYAMDLSAAPASSPSGLALHSRPGRCHPRPEGARARATPRACIRVIARTTFASCCAMSCGAWHEGTPTSRNVVRTRRGASRRRTREHAQMHTGNIGPACRGGIAGQSYAVPADHPSARPPLARLRSAPAHGLPAPPPGAAGLAPTAGPYLRPFCSGANAAPRSPFLPVPPGC
jgi:hypothetical protein